MIKEVVTTVVVSSEVIALVVGTEVIAVVDATSKTDPITNVTRTLHQTKEAADGDAEMATKMRPPIDDHGLFEPVC